MTTRHQVGQLAIIQRAVYNRRRDHINSVCARIDWVNADRKFCEERWNKVRHLKGVYSVEQCWDGAHIVFNGVDGKEVLFDTIFASMSDASFTIRTHELETIRVAPTPVVVEEEEDKDVHPYW